MSNLDSKSFAYLHNMGRLELINTYDKTYFDVFGKIPSHTPTDRTEALELLIGLYENILGSKNIAKLGL